MLQVVLVYPSGTIKSLKHDLRLVQMYLLPFDAG
jgi:hypothetical protein